MEGKGRQGRRSLGQRRSGDRVPGRVQEYDFFLTQGEEAAEQGAPRTEVGKSPEPGETKGERNQSITFFLPE